MKDGPTQSTPKPLRDESFINGIAALAVVLGVMFLIGADSVEHARNPIEVWALVVTVITALIALATLIGVYRQISLAREELDAVKSDLAYSREQSDRMNRTAHLFCYLDSDVAGDYSTGAGNLPTVFRKLFVWNDGSRAARGATAQLAFPKEASLQTLDGWKETSAVIPGFKGIPNNKYVIWERHFTDSFYVNHGALMTLLHLIARGATRPPIYFRVMYDDGTTPEGQTGNPDDDFAELLTFDAAKKAYSKPPDAPSKSPDPL